ncbi:MAG: hypothetical protein ACLUD0_06910 [Eubacterium ramulus]
MGKDKHALRSQSQAEQNRRSWKFLKEHALVEAGEIMERLKTLIPILSATPGEEIPVLEDTVAAALVPMNLRKQKQKKI